MFLWWQQFQHLIRFSVGVTWLSFLIQVMIFQVLCVMNGFQLFPWLFISYVRPSTHVLANFSGLWFQWQFSFQILCNSILVIKISSQLMLWNGDDLGGPDPDQVCPLKAEFSPFANKRRNQIQSTWQIQWSIGSFEDLGLGGEGMWKDQRMFSRSQEPFLSESQQEIRDFSPIAKWNLILSTNLMSVRVDYSLESPDRSLVGWHLDFGHVRLEMACTSVYWTVI